MSFNIPRPDLNLKDLLPQLNFSQLTAEKPGGAAGAAGAAGAGGGVGGGLGAGVGGVGAVAGELAGGVGVAVAGGVNRVLNVPNHLANQIDDLHSIQGLLKAFNLQTAGGDDDDS